MAGVLTTVSLVDGNNCWNLINNGAGGVATKAENFCGSKSNDGANKRVVGRAAVGTSTWLAIRSVNR